MATEKLYVQEANCETGEQVLREFTAEEYAQHALDVAAQAEAKAAQEAADAEKAAQKLAVLTALAEAAGLDVDDVTAALSA